jgi:pyruvate kinase
VQKESSMQVPPHKTKIVCTIGPASSSATVMQEMIRAGMAIARLNFSHGDFESHRRTIRDLRQAAAAVGRDITIMADLPGPKMRVGSLREEPFELRAGDPFTLTTEDVLGDAQRVSVSFENLPKVVHAGDRLFLNDGIIQLEVERVEGTEVHARVRVGGELRSRKGLNLPGVELGISAFTEHDRACLKVALEEGVEAVSQSFVEGAEDVRRVREAARALGQNPFIIAKIERLRALKNLDAILAATDGIMIARGDLGVEIPIEEIAVTQKRLMLKANMLGKPVITATQMLESMTDHRLPTRAEATDVANAIIDGTDCVMLSGESAMGRYPVEAVSMLARIAAATEPNVPRRAVHEALRAYGHEQKASPADLIALGLESMLQYSAPVLIVVPTVSGATARNIARFHHPVWIAAVSSSALTCSALRFSYGTQPVHEPSLPDDWVPYVRKQLADRSVHEGMAILIEGPSPKRPDANHRIELLRLSLAGGQEASHS